nr:hypothetical protein CFP56_65258 [Quercus suber]
MERDSDSDEEIEEIREGFALICLSKEAKQCIRAPWANVLIVKVFGKNVGYNYLHSKLLELWKPIGRVDMVDLGRDCFLLRFSIDEDLEGVLKKGPWFVGGHFLSIRRWKVNFKPSEALVSSVAVWVRLNKLPIEYYDATVLRQIGQALGTVSRFDTHAPRKLEEGDAKKLKITDLRYDSLENVGRFSHGSVKTKPNSNSIKDKKDFARSRATYTNSSQIDRTKDIKNSNTQWTLNISMIQSRQNGRFKFGSNLGNEMGDQRGRQDCGGSASDRRGNKSPTHSVGWFSLKL